MPSSQSKKTALFSLTDKTNSAPFAKQLSVLGFQILSTGGTAAHLREAGIQVIDVSEWTGSPEILNGRVKTLHPKVHGGILFDRQSSQHQADLNSQKIAAIDLVAVNLYDFANHLDIEHIDVGGPTMLRAAAKNHAHVYAVCDPLDYDQIIACLKKNDSKESQELRLHLAKKVFALTAQYDAMISSQLGSPEDFPSVQNIHLSSPKVLRYGENPQQQAAVYKMMARRSTTPQNPTSLVQARFLQGKELSFNNYLDLDSVLAMARDLANLPAVAIVKHTNPCGAAMHPTSITQAYADALACDPESAFGGVVACTRTVDADCAQLMAQTFLECIAAPDFSDEAIKILSAKKNLRLIAIDTSTYGDDEPMQYLGIPGGCLVQTRIKSGAFENQVSSWKMASESFDQNPQELIDLKRQLWFASIVARHAKSNALVCVRGNQTLAIGCGQVSRIDAMRHILAKSQQYAKDLRKSVLASDGFFPFRDVVDLAAECGICAIVQPGGSIRDEDSVAACREHKIMLMLSGERTFKH